LPTTNSPSIHANSSLKIVPETRRLTANEIFEAAVKNARSELRRSGRKLAFSGVAGGITMGLTGMGVSAVRALRGNAGGHDLAPYLMYPIGFVAVIIGRAQLFTENTLYPVILVLDERRHFLSTLRLWAIVFCSNIAGAFLFALLVTKSSALRPDLLNALVQLGTEVCSGTVAHIFWSGVIGGWLIALVAWIVTASHWTIGQMAIIYLLTFAVGAGGFAHCIASSCEILASVIMGTVPAGRYLSWLGAATLGNICGGVFIVSLLNYGQVKEI
jgi:formate-nitrite transporter family protein